MKRNDKFIHVKHRVLDERDLKDIQNTFDRIDATLSSFKENVNSRFNSLQWTMGFIIAGIVAICIKLFV